MSMLKNFFEIGADSTLFDGLYISQNEKLYEEYMGKYRLNLTYDEIDNSIDNLC